MSPEEKGPFRKETANALPATLIRVVRLAGLLVWLSCGACRELVLPSGRPAEDIRGGNEPLSADTLPSPDTGSPDVRGDPSSCGTIVTRASAVEPVVVDVQWPCFRIWDEEWVAARTEHEGQAYHWAANYQGSWMPDAFGGYCGDYNVFAKWYWSVAEGAEGWYEIAAWLPPEPYAPDRVKYKVFSGATCFESASQQVDRARWVSIGVFPFASGGGALRLTNTTTDAPRERRVVFGPIRLSYVPECESPESDLGLAPARCGGGLCVDLAVTDADRVIVTVRPQHDDAFPARVAAELIDDTTGQAVAGTGLTPCDDVSAPPSSVETVLSLEGREGVVRFHARVGVDCGRGAVLESPGMSVARCRASCL